MEPRLRTWRPGESVEGWAAGGSFFGSVIAGTLLGYLADRWLGTAPWLVIIGILLGGYSGFMKLWHLSKENDPGNGSSTRPR